MAGLSVTFVATEPWFAMTYIERESERVSETAHQYIGFRNELNAHDVSKHPGFAQAYFQPLLGSV
jgi:hypothetical protein